MNVRLMTIAALFLTIGLPVSAATLQTGDSVSLSVPISDDLYVAGGDIRIAQNVQGDLVAAGGRVYVSSSVQGDIMAAGGNVQIEGTVSDDVRAVGGTVVINGTVRDDVIVTGGQVEIGPNAVIEGDLIAAGGNITVSGRVNGMTKVSGGAVMIEGTLNGGADIRASDMTLRGTIAGDTTVVGTARLTVEGAGHIQGDLQYWIPQRNQDVKQFVSGAVTYVPALQSGDDAGGRTAAALFLGFTLWQVLAAALLLLVLILGTKTYFRDAAAYMQKKPGMSLLWGLVYFAAMPLVAVLFCITVIGLPIGLFLVTLYIFSLLFARTFASLAIAWWLNVRSNQNWTGIPLFFVSLGVYVVLSVLTLIPLLGWVALLLAVFMSFGGLLMAKKDRWNEIR